MADSDKTAESCGFYKQDAYTDAVLLVENRKLYVSRTVLGMVSPVFRSMFESDFKEKEAEEIILPGKRLTDVVEFLNVLYPSIQKPIKDENLFTILSLADEYQVQNIRSRCAERLVDFCKILADELPTDKLVQIVYAADVYNLPEVMEAALVLTSKRLSSEIEMQPLFERISHRTRIKILDRRLKRVENIFDKGKKNTFLRQLVTLIRQDTVRQDIECTHCDRKLTHMFQVEPSPSKREVLDELLSYGYLCSDCDVTTTLRYLSLAEQLEDMPVLKDTSSLKLVLRAKQKILNSEQCQLKSLCTDRIFRNLSTKSQDQVFERIRNQEGSSPNSIHISNADVDQ